MPIPDLRGYSAISDLAAVALPDALQAGDDTRADGAQQQHPNHDSWQKGKQGNAAQAPNQ